MNERKPSKTGRASFAIDTRSVALSPSASAVRVVEPSFSVAVPQRRDLAERTRDFGAVEPKTETAQECRELVRRAHRVRKRLEEPLQFDENSVDCS